MNFINYIWDWELPYCDPSRGDYSMPLLQALAAVVFQSPVFTPIFILVILFCTALFTDKKYKAGYILLIIYIVFLLFFVPQVACD